MGFFIVLGTLNVRPTLKVLRAPHYTVTCKHNVIQQVSRTCSHSTAETLHVKGNSVSEDVEE